MLELVQVGWILIGYFQWKKFRFFLIFFLKVIPTISFLCSRYSCGVDLPILLQLSLHEWAFSIKQIHIQIPTNT